jgi:hypothetical protein
MLNQSLYVSGDTSDGHHTFDELYDHRLALTVALCRATLRSCWRAKLHHPDDGPMFNGHFIVGIDLPTGMITYHYKLKHWDLFSGSTKLLAHAPKWDGASPEETVKRLKEWQPYG